MGLRSWLVNKYIKKELSRRAAMYDKTTTVLGAVLAALMATNIDYYKLLNGDWQQISLAVATVVVATLGWLINKRGAPVLSDEDLLLMKTLLQQLLESSRRRKDAVQK